MIIVPVSVSVITQAVERLLRADVRMEHVVLARSDEVNALPSQCPWVGIYRADCQFQQRTLGYGQGFRKQRVQVMILAQEADASSGAACEDRLNALVDKIVSILLTDTTLGGAVEAVDEFAVRYPDYRRVADNSYMQTAMITFTALVNVGG
jgi:hypothetical protein